MKILVINPNSSEKMTASVCSVLKRVKRSDTQLMVVRTVGAPPAIQSASDIAQTVPFMLELVRKANRENYDAVILACFSDPGLEAAREQSDILVMGIEETALHVAAMLGHKYTILTPLSKRIPSKEQDVCRFRAESSMASVRALNLTVTETEADPIRTKARILEIATEAVEEDGAEVIILGCAGMTGYANSVQDKLGIVVLDPTVTTFKITEGLVDLGVRHSKRGLYALPLLSALASHYDTAEGESK